MKTNQISVEIEYCIRCRWLLRAAWYAQELLSTFQDDLGGVTLKPSQTAGVFQVVLDGEMIFDRSSERCFIEAKELKKRIRDRIDPDRELGHVDS